jgi:4-amino-4-deoxy-L-arabinose transferase-like glycosyltransferase
VHEPNPRADAKFAYLYAGGAALVGASAAFCVMAADRAWRWGAPVAALGLVVASAACVALMRAGLRDGPAGAASLEEPESHRSHHRIPIGRLGRSLAGVSGAVLVFLVALCGATAGRLGVLLAAVLVPAAFLALVAAVFQLGVALGPWATDELGNRRPLLRRHGFGIMAIATILYLPLLGSFSLFDPWESRYGEVARSMIARGDWISPWWAQDGWDWTKPVLDYWVQAAAMTMLGVDTHPEKMIAAAEGVFSRPEWALRMPSFAMALAALYLLYKAVAAWQGRRAGFLGALVLTTTPHWFFVAHQSMTDMPFVAAMASAMAMLLLALRADPEARVRTYEVTVRGRTLRFDAAHLVFGAILLTALPQILYLASRNVDLAWAATPRGFRPHLDAFTRGSPGNCDLPGNERCAGLTPRYPDFQPAAQAALWAMVTFALLWIKRHERRTARLYAIGAWYLVAISTMAKGPGGLVVPALATFVYLLERRDFSKLLTLEIPLGIGVVASLVLPWYVAAYVRHGSAFTDQLIFHQMLERATAHIHDTNEGDDVSFRYYVWQLGYALFPWTGLTAAALVAWMKKSERAETHRADASVLFAAWFVVAFALFASMPTKFHHYILPAVPPAAMLTGLFLDWVWAESDDPNPRGVHERRMLGGIGVAAAIVVALVGRDLVHHPAASDVEGQARLLHLFTYLYRRPWPDTLDFRTTLAGFTVLGAGAALLLAVDRWRQYAVVASTTTAIAFTAWGLDVYLFRCAPHWGQRELFTKYYGERTGAEEPIVAYQLNWKGENIYTGNHVPVFASSGLPFTNYLKAEQERGKKTFYFVTEHSRTQMLRHEIGAPKTFEQLTDARLNNKFALIRVRFD